MKLITSYPFFTTPKSDDECKKDYRDYIGCIAEIHTTSLQYTRKFEDCEKIYLSYQECRNKVHKMPKSDAN